jgi:hypothetical protein
LRRENPALHTAPKPVERPPSPAPAERTTPDGPCLRESQ